MQGRIVSGQLTVCSASSAVPYAVCFSRKRRDISTNGRWFSHSVRYICLTLMKVCSVRQTDYQSSVKTATKPRPVGTEVLHADGQT